MDMTRATILEGSLDDELWPEIVLAMTYVKNVRPTKALGGDNPYHAQQKIHPDIQHLRVLGSTVYVLLHEEERALKSEKWNPRALRGILVGYDGHTIYRVHIREQNKVIRIKALRIFEDYEAKTSTELPEYKNTPTFSGFLLSDDDDEATSDTQMLDVGRKVNNATGASESTPSKVTPRKGRKVTTRDETTGASNETTETRKPRSGRTIRPTQKAQDQDLIVHLSKLLDLDREHNSEEKANAFLTNIECEEDGHDADDDPYTILTSRLIQANAQSKGDYVLATQLDVEEPESYNRAMQCPHASQWAQAMKEEIDSLHENKTWVLIPKNEMESGHRPLGGKWVYKVKRDVEGKVSRFKARWVIKGYLQQFGVDFDQTYASVVKPMAFRTLFALAAFFDLDIDQMDVKTAFLYGLIDQLIYMEIPKGTETEATKNMVCKLLKAIYGLKQSPRLWYERFSAFLLEKLGLKRIHADHSIFVSGAGLKGPVLSVFVDDIKIMAPKDSGIIKRVKAELTAAFSMSDMGPISFYLGLRIDRDRKQRTIKLSQPAYIEKVLERFHLDKANPVNTPMKESVPLSQREEAEASPPEKERYQGMTGSIMFSMVETRPDIAFATSLVSRFAKNPSHQHTEAVKTILKYLKGSKHRGITYGGDEELKIEGYSDSDWAGDKDSRKSTSGFIFMLNGGPISWCSKRQLTVALSSTEAEYIALTLAAKEATWLRLLLTELGVLEADQQHAEIKVSNKNSCVQAINRDLNSLKPSDGDPTVSLKGDNQGSLALAHNPVFHARTKHIDIQHHYIRDEVEAKRIELTYMPTGEMIADGLTKALTHAKFHTFVEQMQMT